MEVGVKRDLGDFAHTLGLYQIERPSRCTDPATNVFSFGGEQRNRGAEWSFFGTPVTDVRLMGGIVRVAPPKSSRLQAASTAVNQQMRWNNDSVSYWRWFFVCLVASRPVSTTLGLEMLFQNRPVLTG